MFELPTIKCKQCGKTLKTKNKNQKFCNKSCFDKFQDKKIEIKCKTCGKEFKVSPSVAKTRKYCSQKCAGNVPSKITRKCEYCGKKFNPKPNEVKRGNGKYCSRRCYQKDHSKKMRGKNHFRYNRIQKNCEYCGKPFTTVPSEIKKEKGRFCSKKCFYDSETKKVERVCEYCNKKFKTFLSEVVRGGGRYCSPECSSNDMRGEKSPSWKGGLSFEPYCSKFNFEFKERVREFWNRKCGICSKTEKENGIRLSVHHCNYEKMVCCNNVAPLFITTCKSCHAKTNNNREYWEEMLTNYIMIWFNGESYIPSKNPIM